MVTHSAGVIDAIAQMARTGQIAMPETPDLGNDPVALWNRSRDGVIEALDHPDNLGRVGDYWLGESSIDDLLAFTAWDPLGHAWDLAQAVGLDAHTNQDVAEAAIAIIEPRADTLRAMQLMGDPIPV